MTASTSAHVPGPSEILLMLSYWASHGERWARDAHDALVARYPGLGLDRDDTGHIIHHDEMALVELYRAEAHAVAVARVLAGFGFRPS